MKQLFKEPLVHFLALGALPFAGYAVLIHDGVIVAPRGRLGEEVLVESA